FFVIFGGWGLYGGALVAHVVVFFYGRGGVISFCRDPTAEILLIAPTGVWNGRAGAEADSVRPERRLFSESGRRFLR
ncbi:hypothetical protein, partial [Alistipes ihumii]|uniref:hypothetical protein n=1 Tax=Alistipes ihumii TaxID=1470347 RepID=UPI00307CA044